MTLALPEGVRAIVVALSAEYRKKARGTLHAEARVTLPRLSSEPVDHVVSTVVTNAAGDTVCVVHATWRLAPEVAAG